VKKRILLAVAAAVILLGSLSAPVLVRADGTPDPNCPTKTLCKP